MVRRGGKLGGSVKGANRGGRWNRSRSTSTNEVAGNGGGKKSQSAKSSPTMPPHMSRSPSPTISTASSLKRSATPPLSGSSPHNNQANSGGNSSYWRYRGNLRNIDMSDPRFSITKEDFPALPGVRGGGSAKKAPLVAKDENELKPESLGALSNESSPRPHSANSTNENSSTDDSGVSSVSRGNTPPQESAIEVGDVLKKNEKKKGSPSETSPRKQAKAANSSYSSTPQTRLRHTVNVANAKGNNSTNVNNTSPLSFLKLSKNGQKVPERRGRLNSKLNGSPQKPINTSIGDKEDEEEEVVMVEKEEVVEESPVDSFEERKECPKIQLGKDGEMSNIPSSMLDDQFGLAAMLPLLNLMKNRNNSKTSEDEPFTAEQHKEKMIETLACGVDLNSLGVQTKNDQKQVWSTFAGPFGNEPLAPICMGVAFYELPSVYYTARTLQGTIDMNKTMPGKLGVHELFYIFYNFPQEFWQLNTARELQNRGWRYCIPQKLWIHRKVNTDEFGVNSLGQTVSAIFNLPGDEVVAGIFEVYDPEKMRIITREMRLKSSDMEAAGWEQGKEDKMYKALLTILPPEYIWGPQRNSEEKARNAMPASVKTAFNRAPAPPSKTQGTRRILSFVEPDVQEQSLPSTRNEEYQRQMYAAFMQQFSNRYPSSVQAIPSTRPPTNPLYRQPQSTSYHQHHHNHLHHS